MDRDISIIYLFLNSFSGFNSAYISNSKSYIFSLPYCFTFFQFFHLNLVTGYKYIYMRQGVIVEDVGEIFISDACDKVGSPDPIDTYIAQYPGLGRPGYGMSIPTC